MTVEQTAQWLAPAATMIAATMTASNLGTRVTGWGFVIFTIGSLGWSAIGISTGQQGLLLTNAFLTLVNMVGVYRWLGRQARFEKGSKTAEERSDNDKTARLFSAKGTNGAKVFSNDNHNLGAIIDLMLKSESNQVAYAVITDGALGGLEEKLRAVSPEQLSFNHDTVMFDGTAEQFHDIEIIDDKAWPAPRDNDGERVQAS